MSDKFYFKRSDKPQKKYVAIFPSRDGNKPKRVYFGDSRYQQYKDATGLGAWSHMDHGDNRRRRAYHARHQRPGRMYTPSYFSWYYLW